MNGREQEPPSLKPRLLGRISRAQENEYNHLLEALRYSRSAAEGFNFDISFNKFHWYFDNVFELSKQRRKFEKNQPELIEWIERKLPDFAEKGQEMAHLVLESEFLSGNNHSCDELRNVLSVYDWFRTFGHQVDKRRFSIFSEATREWSNRVGNDLQQIAGGINSEKLKFTGSKQAVADFISQWNDLFYPRGKNRSDPIWGQYGIDEDEVLRKGADSLLLSLSIKVRQTHVWDVLVSDQSKVPLYRGPLETKEIKDPLPQAIREFVEEGGRIIDFFRGGQSWVCQVECPNGKIVAVTVFVENASLERNLTPAEVTTRINRRLNTAEKVTKMAKSLPKEAGMAKVQKITKTGKDLDHGFVFVVSDWAEGQDLAKQTSQKGFSEREALKTVLQIARAVDFGYQNYRLIFTDLTPENIIGNGNGGLTLIDCLDCIVEEEQNHQLGKPTFAAPEQRSDNAKLDSKAMVYQLGVLLYFLRTKEGQALNDKDMAYYLSEDPAVRFSKIGECSSNVREIVMRCTRRLADERLSLYALITKLEALTRPPVDEVFQ